MKHYAKISVHILIFTQVQKRTARLGQAKRAGKSMYAIAEES